MTPLPPATDTAALYLKITREIERTADPARKSTLFTHLRMIALAKDLAAGFPAEDMMVMMRFPDVKSDLEAIQKLTAEFVPQMLEALDTLDLDTAPGIDGLLAKSQAILGRRKQLTVKIIKIFAQLGLDYDDSEPTAERNPKALH